MLRLVSGCEGATEEDVLDVPTLPRRHYDHLHLPCAHQHSSGGKHDPQTTRSLRGVSPAWVCIDRSVSVVTAAKVTSNSCL